MNLSSIFKVEKGQAVIEYALILTLISIVTTAALTILGEQITHILKTVTVALGGQV